MVYINRTCLLVTLILTPLYIADKTVPGSCGIVLPERVLLITSLVLPERVQLMTSSVTREGTTNNLSGNREGTTNNLSSVTREWDNLSSDFFF